MRKILTVVAVLLATLPMCAKGKAIVWNDGVISVIHTQAQTAAILFEADGKTVDVLGVSNTSSIPLEKHMAMNGYALWFDTVLSHEVENPISFHVQYAVEGVKKGKNVLQVKMGDNISTLLYAAPDTVESAVSRFGATQRAVQRIETTVNSSTAWYVHGVEYQVAESPTARVAFRVISTDSPWPYVKVFIALHNKSGHTVQFDPWSAVVGTLNDLQIPPVSFEQYTEVMQDELKKQNIRSILSNDLGSALNGESSQPDINDQEVANADNIQTVVNQHMQKETLGNGQGVEGYMFFAFKPTYVTITVDGARYGFQCKY